MKTKSKKKNKKRQSVKATTKKVVTKKTVFKKVSRKKVVKEKVRNKKTYKSVKKTTLIPRKYKETDTISKNNEVVESLQAPQKKARRDIGVEVLRVLACLTVCIYHIRLFAQKIDGTISETYTLLECTLAICVMSFFFITGFFIYRKKGNIIINWLKLILNTFITIIIPTVIVVSICVIFNEYCINIKTFDECIANIDLVNIKNTVIEGFKVMTTAPWPGTAAHLWYIFAYLYIIISYPLVQLIINKVPKTIIYILLAYLILIGIINDIWIFDNDFFFHKLFDYIKKPVIYCMVGHYLYNDFLVKIRDKESDFFIKDIKSFVVGAAIYILSIITMYHFQYNYYVKYDVQIYVYTSWLSMFSMFLTLGFFLMVYNINFDKLWNDGIKKVVMYVSKQTFIIFLIHYLFVIRFVCTGFQDAWHQDFTNAFQYILYYLFYGSFIFSISLAVSMVITSITSLFKKNFR